MKIMLLIGSLVLASATTLLPKASRAEEPIMALQGWMPYTPSRLEWLALEMRSRVGRNATMDSPYMLDFLPLANTDTIKIIARYMPWANKDLMRVEVDSARKLLEAYCAGRGWKWLRIQESIEPMESP